MKYAKASRYALILALLGGLGACTANEGKVREQRTTEKPALTSTEAFLPQLDYDEQGNPLPYEPEPNPYTEAKGVVERDTVQNYIQARRAFRAARFQEADRLLVDLIKEEPKLSGPLVMRGDIAMTTENLEGAIKFYQAALEINPINFNAYLRLAKAQRMLGDFAAAQNTYATALSKWPDGAELHLNLGVLYDVYLNEPLRAQAHMEAYQLLSGDNSGDVVRWLEEIRERTEVANAMEAQREGNTHSHNHAKADEPMLTAHESGEE